MQSALHVAIIMDGNGRWATRRGRPRARGHLAGAEAVRRTVEAAPGLGIATLTLYAFSGANWQRPAPEVRGLLALFLRYLARERDTFLEHGIRLSVIGRRDRLPAQLVRQIAATEALTAAGTNLHLRLAVDYSARDAIVGAAARAVAGGRVPDPDVFPRLLAEAMHAWEPAPDVDLLIRTGGEVRLSDFMLWECAWAELAFAQTMWPDWTGDDLAAAVADFRTRDRRYGRLPAAS